MLALSIRQPWAWLILHGGKDIENRDWRTRVRGRVLVHAAKGCTRDEYDDAAWFADPQPGTPAVPVLANLPRGGIVGSVEIVDCVTHSKSRWFIGHFGFVLRDPKPLPFVPWRGQLGFFDVPEDAVSNAEPTGDALMSNDEPQALPADLRLSAELGLGDRLREMSRRGYWPLLGDEAAAEIDRLNSERLDMALLIGRLIRRMRAARDGRGIAAGDEALEQQAIGYLKRKGLPSPLRDEGPNADVVRLDAAGGQSERT